MLFTIALRVLGLVGAVIVAFWILAKPWRIYGMLAILPLASALISLKFGVFMFFFALFCALESGFIDYAKWRRNTPIVATLKKEWELPDIAKGGLVTVPAGRYVLEEGKNAHGMKCFFLEGTKAGFLKSGWLHFGRQYARYVNPKWYIALEGLNPLDMLRRRRIEKRGRQEFIEADYTTYGAMQQRWAELEV